MTVPTPKSAEELLADVHPDSSFRLSDGSEISSLRELYRNLQEMDRKVFSHHVNEERNDFGNWVKDIHKDYRLANSLFSCDSRDACSKAVAGRIYELEKMISPPEQSIALPAPEPEAIPKQQPKIQEEKKVEKRVEKRVDNESLIAQAILQGKSVEHLLPKRKKAKAAAPAEAVPKNREPKDEMETASERLEKILSAAAKASMEEAKKNPSEPRIRNESRVSEAPPVLRQAPEKEVTEEQKPSASEILYEISASDLKIEESGPSTEEVIQLIESKSFAGQVKSDMKSLFSGGSLKGVATDLSRMMPGNLRRKDKKLPDPDDRDTVIPRNEEEQVPIPEEAEEQVTATVSDKEKILSHLKQVYGQ